MLREYLSETMDFVLYDPPYTVQKDQDDDHAKYNVLISNDLLNLSKVLGDLMKLGTHGHVFCSALQSDLCFKALASKKEIESQREGVFCRGRP